jgi:hypothetical protein
VRIGGIFEVNTSRRKERVKLGVVLVAQRNREPRHMVLTADVMTHYPFVATADHAPTADLCAHGHAPLASEA